MEGWGSIINEETFGVEYQSQTATLGEIEVLL